MTNQIKNWIADSFPSLGKYKRSLVALKDTLFPIQESYSQHQEDIFIWRTLSKYNLDGSIYLDIGANHPTDISNTYLLYRKKLSGVIVEPNPELISLFHRFRKRDIALPVGCSDKASLSRFNISKTPVVSSFILNRDVNVHRSVFVPILPIDTLVNELAYEYISLLSIDVEGLNVEVLKGAIETLKKTLLVCIEFDSEDEKLEFEQLLGSNFLLIKEIGCNAIFLNQIVSQERAIKWERKATFV